MLKFCEIVMQIIMYPYTLQPVALDLQKDDIIAVQKALFIRQSQHTFSIKAIKKTEWIGLVLAALISILGIVFIHGYSRALFWLVLVLCGLYLLVRTAGLKWYVTQEFEKQLCNVHFPSQMQGVRLGVQPQGLILQMSQKEPAFTKDGAPKKGRRQGRKRGHVQTVQVQNIAHQALIGWDKVVAWDEIDTHFLVAFDMQGQKGTQIIPKRKNLPIDSIRKHLSSVRIQGFSQSDIKNLMG